MKHINLASFKRDSEHIKKLMIDKGGKVVAGKDIVIVIPSRYENKDLLTLGTIVTTLAIFIIVDMDAKKYSVHNVPVLMKLLPNLVDNGFIDDSPSKFLYFEKDEIVVPSTTIPMASHYLFDLVEEFVLNGNVPLFLNPFDLAKMFLYLRHYTGSSIGDNFLTMVIISSLLSRDKNDPTKYLRETAKTVKDFDNVTYVGFGDPTSSFPDTGNKLGGAHLKTTTVAAIVRPNTDVINKSEEILMM